MCFLKGYDKLTLNQKLCFFSSPINREYLCATYWSPKGNIFLVLVGTFLGNIFVVLIGILKGISLWYSLESQREFLCGTHWDP